MGELEDAIRRLKLQYADLDFTHGQTPHAGSEVRYSWPGPDDEDVMIVAHQSSGSCEPFHQHDFFYFNYTYEGSYESLSQTYDNKITVATGELYAGQPSAGHALLVHDDVQTTIVGMLVRRDAFARTFLPLLSTDARFLRFLLDPTTDRFADEFIHFKLEDQCIPRALMEMMAREYANKRPDTQEIIRPLALAFLMQVARQYASSSKAGTPASPAELMTRFIEDHADSVTLASLAKQFSYHPNYVSTLLREKTGKSFSELLLEARMKRAAILLKGTDLPVAEVARILGYTSTSSFHKAFRTHFEATPREYAADAR